MTERYDFYRTVHRGLRHAHGLMLTRLGATDPTDPAARAETLAALDRHLETVRNPSCRRGQRDPPRAGAAPPRRGGRRR